MFNISMIDVYQCVSNGVAGMFSIQIADYSNMKIEQWQRKYRTIAEL